MNLFKSSSGGYLLFELNKVQKISDSNDYNLVGLTKCFSSLLTQNQRKARLTNKDYKLIVPKEYM